MKRFAVIMKWLTLILGIIGVGFVLFDIYAEDFRSVLNDILIVVLNGFSFAIYKSLAEDFD